jgi:hypothetical protein
MSMLSVVETAYLLADSDTAARAYPLLAPFAELPAMLTGCVVCLGSVHHGLGLASLTIGELDRAVEHLRAAVYGNLALGRGGPGLVPRTAAQHLYQGAHLTVR